MLFERILHDMSGIYSFFYVACEICGEYQRHLDLHCSINALVSKILGFIHL